MVKKYRRQVKEIEKEDNKLYGAQVADTYLRHMFLGYDGNLSMGIREPIYHAS